MTAIYDLVHQRLGSRFIIEALKHEEHLHLLTDQQSHHLVLAFLRDDPDTQLDRLLDLFAIEHVNHNSFRWSIQPVLPCIELVYLLQSHRFGHDMFVSILLPSDKNLCLSASSLYASALAFENEIWDLFGVEFEGHPNIRRLTMYAGFAGHPLRKNYPISKAQPIAAWGFTRDRQ